MAITHGKIIADIRMLMGKGEDGIKWRWTDAGWGGDWGVFYERDRLKPFQWKTAYVSHGPCLTDVHYSGWYGAKKKVFMSASVHTSRTDDYSRTTTMLTYEFRASMHNFPKTSFFELGTTAEIYTPTVAWGDIEGLVEEIDLGQVPLGMYLSKEEMDGDGPWWFGFPGQNITDGRKWGKGWRACIIRNYKASFGGQIYDRPTFSLFNHGRSDRKANMKFMIQSPEGVKEFTDSDWISFEITVLSFPKDHNDYYGPNESFKSHLRVNPNSWKTVHREVVGNHISVTIDSGGDLVSNYPIVITVSNPDKECSLGEDEVHFTISGGIGAVPIKFIGLDSRDYMLYQQFYDGEVPLDQSVYKNDFWQTEFSFEYEMDEEMLGTYSLAYNLKLDAFLVSSWVLRKIDKNRNSSVQFTLD